MKELFFRDLSKVSNENRLLQHKIRIIQIIAQNRDSISVPDICRLLQLSAPTAIKLVNELKNDGFLTATGKKETVNGRKPILYSLSSPNTYALSVEIVLKRITVGLIDLKLNTVYYRQKTDFILENTPDCLRKVEGFIFECLRHSGITIDQILGLGIGISGLVNGVKGASETYFNFMKTPIAPYFSDIFNLPVFLGNETGCFALAERVVGKAASAHNAIVISLSRQLGAGLIIDNKIVKGEMGFAGEIGHMQFGSKEKICQCGKMGCIATEIGGGILENKFLERLAAGEPSLVSMPTDGTVFRYDAILAGALKGDTLSISLVQEMAAKL